MSSLRLVDCLMWGYQTSGLTPEGCIQETPHLLGCWGGWMTTLICVAIPRRSLAEWVVGPHARLRTTLSHIAREQRA